MIGSLRGRLTAKLAPQIVVECSGVGYELETPMSTFLDLPELGSNLFLHTHLLVREDAQILYGFSTQDERSMFRTLLKVNRVGAKLALGILSAMSTNDFRRCVELEDTTSMSKIPGVGKKTAERLIIEINHAGQIEQGRAEQSHVEHDGGGGETFAVPDRPADVGEEEQNIANHQPVERTGNLKEFAALPDVHVVTDDGGDPDKQEGDQLHVGELGPGEFALGLFGDDEIGGAHETEQQPDEQQVGMHRTGGIERDDVVQAIVSHVGEAHDEAVNDL